MDGKESYEIKLYKNPTVIYFLVFDFYQRKSKISMQHIKPNKIRIEQDGIQ